MHSLCVTVVVLAVLNITFGNEEVNVTISSGTIAGLCLETKTGVNYYSFRGIPYAEPPLGELRFLPPKPVQTWKGILNATQYGKTCLQYQPNPEKESEDCLFLNVHTPDLTCNTTYPTMVFIHGGSFRSGSGNVGPEYFVENDVILVSMNYRLGPFGSLSAQDTVIPGNAGLKDQRLALRWLQENIEFFCGDARLITIFGQNVGGASVGYHIMSSTGMFRAAILQSGSPIKPFTLQRNPKSVLNRTVAAVANITNNTAPENGNSKSILEYLQSVDSSAISAAGIVVYKQLLASGDLPDLVGYSFSPSVEVESEEAIVTGLTFEKFSKGNIIDIPVIIGVTSEEALGYFTNAQLKKYMHFYNKHLEKISPVSLNTRNTEKMREVGQLVKDFYNIYYNSSTFSEEQEAFATRFFSDVGACRGIMKQAQLQSRYADVYFYKFSYSGLLGGTSLKFKDAGKAPHGAELDYMFSSDVDINDYPKSDILTSRRLVKLWTNFAKNLNPIHSEDDIFQNVTWPKVNRFNATDIVYLNIDDNLSVEKNPRGDSLNFWNSIFEKYGNPPYSTF